MTPRIIVGATPANGTEGDYAERTTCRLCAYHNAVMDVVDGRRPGKTWDSRSRSGIQTCNVFARWITYGKPSQVVARQFCSGARAYQCTAMEPLRNIRHVIGV